MKWESGVNIRKGLYGAAVMTCLTAIQPAAAQSGTQRLLPGTVWCLTFDGIAKVGIGMSADELVVLGCTRTPAEGGIVTIVARQGRAVMAQIYSSKEMIWTDQSSVTSR